MLRDGTDRFGRTAALQGVAIVTAIPSPAFDALAVGWCGVRLVRQVAALHGMRPGLLGTFVLPRKTTLAAATVAAAEMTVNAATHAVIAPPVAAFGGRRGGRGRGGAPHDGIGTCRRRGLFTAVAGMSLADSPTKYQGSRAKRRGSLPFWARWTLAESGWESSGWSGERNRDPTLSRRRSFFIHIDKRQERQVE